MLTQIKHFVKSRFCLLIFHFGLLSLSVRLLFQPFFLAERRVYSKSFVTSFNVHPSVPVQRASQKRWRFFGFGFGAGVGEINKRVLIPALNEINHQPSKKVVFFAVNRQKCRLILTVKKFQGFSVLTISADLHGPLAPEESLRN